MGPVSYRGARVRVLLIAALAAAGCGGGASGRLGGSTLPESVEAPAPSAERYATEPSSAPIIGPESEATAVRRGVERAAAKHETDIRGDGRLGLLAAWTAERLGEGGTPPPHELVEFFAHHLGLVEPTPHLLIRGQPDPAALEDGIADSVSQFLARQPYNYYGAAVVRREGLTLAVVVLSSRLVNLQPVPRRIAGGQAIVLEGRLHEGYKDAKLALAMPDGQVVRRPVGHDSTFSARVPSGASGTYGVELIAEGPRGETVVANFPVYVGVDVPSSVSLSIPDDEGDGGDVGQVAERLLQLANQTRSEAGLPPVQHHPGLERVALAHSRDMVEHGFVGHSSPTTGSAPDRVRRAGFASGLVLENIGRGYGAAGMHRGLLQSPGHRANLLNPDVTHVGIGVVAEDEGERMAFVATEVFVRMAQEIDVGRAPAQLLELINRNRRARGAEPLEDDPNLRQAAQEAAEAFFRDSTLSQQDVVDDASAGLKRFSIAYKRIGGVMAVVTVLEEASRLEPAFESDLRYVGIGVSQGSRPDTPSNAIAVVIMLAWPR